MHIRIMCTPLAILCDKNDKPFNGIVHLIRPTFYQMNQINGYIHICEILKIQNHVEWFPNPKCLITLYVELLSMHKYYTI